MRDMTLADRMRLRATHGPHKLFRTLLEGRDERQLLVADLTPSQWMHLRTLLELGFVDVVDGRTDVRFTVSSLKRLGYLA